jgi:hypothetical protein
MLQIRLVRVIRESHVFGPRTCAWHRHCGAGIQRCEELPLPFVHASRLYLTVRICITFNTMYLDSI